MVCNVYALEGKCIINGKVIEKNNGNPLPFATVSIINTENKIIGGATSGADGKFSMRDIIDGKCNVKVSYIGYRDTIFSITIEKNNTNINLGDVKLVSDATALNAAIIRVKVPIIEQKTDKIIMNVSEAVITQGNNALDILRKAPGVCIDPSGNIMLNGALVEIWIDGRPSNMVGSELNALLNGTDGSTIDKIEIIAHPSAKYDASGNGGIINIKIRRNLIKGISGSLKAGYTASIYETYYQNTDGTINLNYRSNNTNTSITYSPSYIENFNNFYSTTKYGNGQILEGTTESDKINRNNSFRVVNDYFINKNNTLGLIIKGYFNNSFDKTNDATTGSNLYNNGNLMERINTRIDNNDLIESLAGNLNYTHTFKGNKEITFDTDYGSYKINKESFHDNYYFDNLGEETRIPLLYRSCSDQLIKILSFKADYVQDIFKSIKFEAGMKYGQSKTDNNFIAENEYNNNWVINNQLSNKFNYTENIAAAYVSLAKQFGKKWSIKGGLRAEYTYAKGDWISAEMVTYQKKMDIFPTLFAGYSPNKNINLGFSYSKRIRRPNYNQLNPFRVFLDSNSSLEGNPNLKSQYSSLISLTIGIKQHFNFGLHGQFMNGVIIRNVHFNNQNGENNMVWENFGKQNFIGGDFSLTEFSVFKWLIINGNITLASVQNNYSDYKWNTLFAVANIYTTIILPEDIKLELIGLIQSRVPYGYFVVEPSKELSFGIKKSIFQNKGTLSINVNDIFNSRNNGAMLNNNLVKNYNYKSESNSRQVSLSFMYRFGTTKSMKRRRVGNLEEAGRVSNDN